MFIYLLKNMHIHLKVPGFHLMDWCIQALSDPDKRTRIKNPKQKHRHHIQEVWLQLHTFSKMCIYLWDREQKCIWTSLMFYLLPLLLWECWHGLDEVAPDNPEKKIGLKRQGYTFNITIIKDKLQSWRGRIFFSFAIHVKTQNSVTFFLKFWGF